MRVISSSCAMAEVYCSAGKGLQCLPLDLSIESLYLYLGVIPIFLAAIKYYRVFAYWNVNDFLLRFRFDSNSS